MTVGKKIKEVRNSKKLTQAQLAERLGVTQPTVQQYEGGRRKPKAKTLHRIADALGVDVRELDSRVFTFRDQGVDEDATQEDLLKHIKDISYSINELLHVFEELGLDAEDRELVTDFAIDFANTLAERSKKERKDSKK